MTAFYRIDVLKDILDLGLVPLFYHPDVETAQAVVLALAGGGARVVEFTNRGANAYPVFTRLAETVRKNHPGLKLGVGSVIDPETAALFAAAGADFIVGPSLNRDLAAFCNLRKLAYLPGAFTPTEISEAEKTGVEIVKIFPGELCGPAYIKSILAPCPWHRLLITGGVEDDEQNITAWFQAGAAAVGMGSRLITKSILAEKNYALLSQRTAAILGWIRAARA